MAANTLSILSLGASHIAVTSITSGTDGVVVLEDVIHEPIYGDPQLKNAWMDEVEKGLRNVAGKTSLSEVSEVILPSWAVLSKLIKIAKIEGDGQREVVRFEAANTLPNGLDGFDWDYWELGNDGYEKDVLVQAVSTTFLAELLEVLKRYGVKPERVQGIFSAELNAMSEQYTPGSKAALLLDIGSRSVSLIIKARGELPFIRSFGFGGSQVTQAIAQKLEMSFTKAEQLKLETLEKAADSNNLSTLNETSEGFVARLVSEVQRTLALYRRQGQSGNPECILLAGGGSQLPGLADFLERKTGIVTRLYDPFRGITSGRRLPMSQTGSLSYLLPAPMGVAFGNGQSANLLSGGAYSRQGGGNRNVWLTAAASMALLAGLIVGLKFHLGVLDIQQRIAVLEAELDPMESLAEQVNEEFALYTYRTKLVESKQGLLTKRTQWGAVLADLQERLNRVEDVWLESIKQETLSASDTIERLRVTGRLLDRQNPLSVVSSNSRSRVEVLLGSFEDSPFIESVADRRFDTSRPGILRFDFSLIIDREASL